MNIDSIFGENVVRGTSAKEWMDPFVVIAQLGGLEWCQNAMRKITINIGFVTNALFAFHKSIQESRTGQNGDVVNPRNTAGNDETRRYLRGHYSATKANQI